jgi:hypothetical protein
MWESQRDFQRVWEAGIMAFHAFHTLSTGMVRRLFHAGLSWQVGGLPWKSQLSALT